MIAGKTHSEILVMKPSSRSRWYKTILPEEEEEAKMMMQNVKSIKLSALWTPERKTKHREYMMMEENNPMNRPEVRTKHKEAVNRPEYRAKQGEDTRGRKHTEESNTKRRVWWTPERRAERKASITGENNPNFGKTTPEETRVKQREAWTPERKTKQCGENHYNWQGGLSFEPYGIEFNDELRSQIRERDNHTCQECQHTEKQLGCILDVHHIDYDKKNNSPENLISLCRSCHSQTNFGREDWTEYFGKILEGNGG